MAKKTRRSLPLPPRKPLHRRALRAVAAAPGKLLQRVNQELYRRNAELAARNKTLALLRKLDEISLATLSRKEMAAQMAAAIAEALGYDVVAIATPSQPGRSWQTVGAGSSVPWIKKVLASLDLPSLKQPVSSGLFSRAIATGQVQFADDSRLVYSPDFLAALQQADETPSVAEVANNLLFPLRFGQETIGLLKISASRSLADISSFERDSVTGITGLVALALYKAKIYEDLQRATAQLEDANQQLKNLDKANKEFLSLASHQLYSPVTALKGYLSMIQEGDFGATPEKFVPIIEILRKSTEHLITLIKQYLDISRIEAGRLELKLESLNLVEMSQQLVQDLMPNAIAKNLKLQFHAPPALPTPVVADAERLRQVMLNFIDNAIKYTEQGTVAVQVTQRADQVIFSVVDTGKGMTPEEIERLFVKFTRVGGENRFRTEGTGLGLYLARQIVKEHHGEVKAESLGPGRGSVLSMLLPAEGSPASLQAGAPTSVEIKAAEAQDKKT